MVPEAMGGVDDDCSDEFVDTGGDLEIFRRPNATKIVVLAVNVALVGYLVWVVKKADVGKSENGKWEIEEAGRFGLRET